MTYDGALVMPKNYVAMSDEEMMYLEGGANPYLVVSGGALYIIGLNASRAYTRTVTRQGKKYTVTYTPTNKLKNFGKACKITGVTVGTAGFSKIIGGALGWGYSMLTTKWL